MAKGYALTIGINDYSQWGGTAGNLPSCIEDAKFMNSLAKAFGYSELYHFVDRDASLRNVVEAIISMSKRAVAGDVVLIYYSGHGTVDPDAGGSAGDEVPDMLYQGKFDSGYCLYDNVVLHDDFFTLLLKLFATGVRIYVVSDACFSFSMVDEVTCVSVSAKMITSKLDHMANSKLKTTMDTVFPAFGPKRKQELLNLLTATNKKYMEASIIEFSSSSNMATSLAGHTLSLFTRSISENIYHSFLVAPYPMWKLKAHCSSDLYTAFQSMYQDEATRLEDILLLHESGLDSNVIHLPVQDQIATLVAYKFPRLQYKGKFNKDFQQQRVFTI